MMVRKQVHAVWLHLVAFLLLTVHTGRALSMYVTGRSVVRTRHTALHFNKPSGSGGTNRNEFDPEGDGDDDDDFDLDRAIDTKMEKRFRGPPSAGRRPAAVVKNLNRWEVINRALLAGAFVAGIGSGITIDSAINTNPRDLASRCVPLP